MVIVGVLHQVLAKITEQLESLYKSWVQAGYTASRIGMWSSLEPIAILSLPN